MSDASPGAATVAKSDAAGMATDAMLTGAIMTGAKAKDAVGMATGAKVTDATGKATDADVDGAVTIAINKKGR